MPIPRVKTIAKSIEWPRSKCGDNWDKSVKVRKSYRGLDRYFRKMLSLADRHHVATYDEKLVAQLERERARVVKSFIDKNVILTPKQRQNLKPFLERAGTYLRDAAKIQSSWSSGFATTNFGNVPAIPLQMNPPQGTSSEVIYGHKKDSMKWISLIIAAMKNIRCAEEVICKAEVFRLNKAAWEKLPPIQRRSWRQNT